MARPQVVDGGDGLQIWRVAVNILNKQSRTADKGWHSSFGVAQEANNPHRKKTSGFGGGFCEHGNEHSSSTNGREFLGYVSDYKLFKKDSAPQSYLVASCVKHFK
jgi:hypothetical protein